MMKKTFVIYTACLFVWVTAPARAEEGVDYGYWCNDCGRQHGPGELCPAREGGSSVQYDTPYFQQERTYIDPVENAHNQARSINDEGLEYFKKGNYSAAAGRFKAALEKWPDSEQINRNYERAKGELEWEKGSGERERKERLEKNISREAELDKKLFEGHAFINVQLYDTSVVDLRDKKEPLVVDPVIASRLVEDFPGAMRQRTKTSNPQVREIIRLLKAEPPSPVKNISSLEIGDVILVAPDGLMSSLVNITDRWGSGNPDSPASHTATFLGERDGKRWYFNTTPETGPVIMDEKDFLEKYANRKMDVATLVGQPISKLEGEELWKGAAELEKSASYGIKILGKSNSLVCSEASRWLLLRAGRSVPQTQSKDKNILGIDVNKKQFVDFSPSDFYGDQQYFIVHTLGIKK